MSVKSCRCLKSASLLDNQILILRFVIELFYQGLISKETVVLPQWRVRHKNLVLPSKLIAESGFQLSVESNSAIALVLHCYAL